MKRFLLILTSLLCLSAFASDDCNPVSLKTSSATFNGCEQGNVRAFRGIRYAQAARWQAPEIIVPSGTVDATTYGAYCAQIPYDPSQSEDCLYVNVWSPKDAKDLPVFFWIHGGGFLQGSGAQINYDGQFLADAYNVVVVTINYRLGFLGYRYDENGSGNYGIKDQITALQWTQQHIADFGGNPDAVTIVGESAGAMSVGLQFTLEESQDLFKAGIMESSYYGVSYMSAEEAKRLSDYITMGQKACAQQPCTTVEITNIQQLFMNNLTALEDMWMFGPYIDGQLVKTQPITNDIKKPLLMGTNSAEDVLFTFQYIRNFGVIDYTLELVKFFGLEKAATISAQPRYNPTQQGAFQALNNVVQDGLFVCSTRYLLDNANSATTYGYDFTYQSSFEFYPHFPPCNKDVCHGEDLPYVFNTAYNVMGAPVTFSADDEAMAKTVSSHWATMVKTHTPGDDWQTFEAMGRLILDKGDKVTYTQDENCDCDFWNQQIYEVGGTTGTVNRILNIGSGKKVLSGGKLHDPRRH